jgi:DNA topoisomerase IB
MASTLRLPDELVYVHGDELALRRERHGDRFTIVDAAGCDPVTDPQTLARVEALRIPPAWSDVWIASQTDAHLQATGLDSKGRRQYLYHRAWRERRDAEKFDDMLRFAGRLPHVRTTACGLLESVDGIRRERILALAVRLLDIGFFRVGWDRYARDNGHVGLTTLRRDQVALTPDGRVQFDYVAKAGKRRRMIVRDPQAARALEPLARRRDGPAELLVFRPAATPPDWRRVHASDVNNTLRCWAQGPFSAKEFRTWAATVLAAVALAREDAAGRRDRRAVSRAVRQVSLALGNTPTVARASYVDPRILDAFEDGATIELPADLPPGAVPLRIDAGTDGIVIELPSDVDGDAPRLEVERRVLELLRRRAAA